MLQNSKLTVCNLMSVRFTLTRVPHSRNPFNNKNIRATLSADIPMSVGSFSTIRGTLNNHHHFQLLTIY